MTPRRVTPPQPIRAGDDPDASNNADDPGSKAAITAAYNVMAADPDTHLSYEIARRRRQQHAHHYTDRYKDEPDTQLPPQGPHDE